MAKAPPDRPALDARALLARVAFLRDAGAAALDDLASRAVSRHWPKGTRLFARGDEGGFFVVLAEGGLRLSLTALDGRELTIRLVGPGEVAGELAVLDGALRTTDADTTADSRGIVIRRDAFQRVLAAHPAMAQALVAFLCARLRGTTDQIEAIALLPLEARLARLFLTFLQQAGHGTEGGGRADLRLGIDQSEMARILGASRPRTNQALRALREEGAIAPLDGGWRCDLAALRSLGEDPEG